MGKIIFLNGRFLPQTEAKLSVLTEGFLYGWGLFETMRAYNNRIVYFAQHLKRIKQSCALMDIKFPYSMPKLRAIIKRTIKINGFLDTYVRLTLWKSGLDTDTLVIAEKYQPPQKYGRGFHACLAPFRQNESSAFARLKTTNYLLYRLAYLKAKDRGFDEAIILNNRGYIAEGSRSNLFLVKDKEVFTPALECGCLEGITRKVIFDLAKKYNFEISEGNFTLQDLCAADEAFLTNSLVGVTPLVSVENCRLGNGINSYKLTRFFMDKYKALLRNEV